jgi:hypothetical protein
MNGNFSGPIPTGVCIHRFHLKSLMAMVDSLDWEDTAHHTLNGENNNPQVSFEAPRAPPFVTVAGGTRTSATQTADILIHQDIHSQLVDP